MTGMRCTQKRRYQQVVEAFAAGLHMAALATGITIVGLEDISLLVKFQTEISQVPLLHLL